MVLQELLIKLGLSGGGATVKALDKVDSKVKSVTDSFRSLGGMMTGIFAGLSIKSIIDTADHMQSLEFRLGRMETSANGGADAFDNLAKHAEKSRVSIETYAEAYTGIGAATHGLITTQEDLLKVTDSVAMGLQLAGANTQQTTSVMQQLTQAIAVGKLQWADFRIIIQNSDNFAKILAKSLGMSYNDLVKAVQGPGGGIAAKKIVEAFRNMNSEVLKEFTKMPLTISQALTVIGVRWDGFIHRLNRGSSSVSKIANWFLWLADKVEYAMNEVVKAVGGAENAIALLASALSGLGVIASVMALKSAFAALASPLALVALAAASLYLAFDDFRVWRNGGDSILGGLFGDYSQYSETIEGILNAIRSIKNGIGGWKTIFEAFSIYLGGRWLMSVLKTFGLVSKAATGAVGEIGSIGREKQGGKFKKGLNKALSFSILYPLVDGVFQETLGDTKFGKWAHETTLGDVWKGAKNYFNPEFARTTYSGLLRGYDSKPPNSDQTINYSPIVTLTVNASTGTPEDIKKAVDEAMSGQLPRITSAFSSDMLFNRGVSR